MHTDILIIPHKKLRQKALPVVDFDKDMLFSLTNSMLRALETYRAVGLAATQLGLPIRVLVAHADRYPLVMVNPQIIKKSGSFLSKEGCLSIPSYWDRVERSNKIVVKYQDIGGKEKEDTLYGFEAAVIQHEIDHLDGILFIDHLSELKQARAKKKVERWKRQNNLKHKNIREI